MVTKGAARRSGEAGPEVRDEGAFERAQAQAGGAQFYLLKLAAGFVDEGDGFRHGVGDRGQYLGGGQIGQGDTGQPRRVRRAQAIARGRIGRWRKRPAPP